MEIRGIIITNTETLKDSFFLPELWENIENGTLRLFERDLAKGHDPQGIAKEIAAVLEEKQFETGAALLRDGGLDLEALKGRILLGGGSQNRVTLGKQFLENNESAICGLTQPILERCSPRQAWETTLFLLLNLQARPREELEDTAFLARQLAQLRETQVAPLSGGTGAPAADLPGDRLCLHGSKLLALQDGWICQWQEGGFTPLRSAGDSVAGFTYTDQLGLIAFDLEGKLCGKVHPLLRSLAEGKALRQVTACLGQFALLDGEGALLTDPKCRLPSQDAWKQLHRIHRGMNSLTGIQGPMRRAIQWGSDQALEEYTGVRTIDTDSRRGVRRYALLCEGGELFTDDGRSETEVSAACLYSGGYVYVKGQRIYKRPFGGDNLQMLTDQLPEGFRAEEVHAGEGIVACGGMLNGVFHVEVVVC